MKLYEFEGHSLLSKVGIVSPFFVACSNLDEVQEARKRLRFPIVVKVQVLSGKRGKGGGIKICTNEKQLVDFCKKMFDADFGPSTDSGQVGEEVRFIALAEKVEIESEFYASITYDTVLKIPFLLFSKSGGMDIEEVRAKNPEEIIRMDINPFLGPNKKDLAKVLGRDENLADFVLRLWDAFVRYDCRLVEVNPIAKILGPVDSFPPASARLKLKSKGDGKPDVNLRAVGNPSTIATQTREEYVAVDAKIILDDAALSRHRDIDVLPKGAAGAVPTQREMAAKKIDEEDYRGSAGSTFIEFGGDIAVLASGGGASLLVMDALVANGAKPSNYTEYSGNPPRGKVEKLTKITLSKEGLAGCLVCGAVANFTDIYETLAGFADGLKQVTPKPDYPIVIRRGGPRQKEAYEMLEVFAKKEGFDIHLFGPETPISVACEKMVELSKEFKRESFASKGQKAEVKSTS